jgi:hypothetical protein
MRSLRAALIAAAVISTGCWHPLARPSARHTATPLPGGGVLVVGGGKSYPPSDRVGRYQHGRWRTAASLPVGLVGHTTTLLLDGRVLVLGGYGPEVEDRAEALVYEPTRDRWRAVAPMAHARAHHSATRLADGRVLVVGGQHLESEVELYDPRTNTWSLAANPENSFPYPVTLLLRDGRMLLLSGAGTALLYDPRADQWRATNPVVQPREQHTTTLLPDGRVLLAGGRAYVDGTLSDVALDSTEIYDPRRDRWMPGPRLQTARSSHTATLVGSVLVIAGGMPSGWGEQKPLRTAELLDLAHGRWSTRSIGRRRADHTATALPDGRLMLIGGRTEMIVNKWTLRWSKTLRLRGDLHRAARREPTGAIDPGLGAHGSRAPRSP